MRVSKADKEVLEVIGTNLKVKKKNDFFVCLT